MSNDNKNKKFDIIGDIAKSARREKNGTQQEERSARDNMGDVRINRYGTYEGYKDVAVNKAMQADKYKINFSLDEEHTQKLQYLQSLEQVGLREYSKLADIAIDLLYEVKFLLNIKVVDTNPITLIRMIQEAKQRD